MTPKSTVPLAIMDTTYNKIILVSHHVTNISTRIDGITVVMTVAASVQIVLAHRTLLVPIAELQSTSCPTKPVGTVLPIVPQLTTSRLAPTVCHVTRLVSLVMESPVLTVILVLMAYSCTVDIVDMYVHRRLFLINKH